jgi:hypothetical protein
MSKRDKIIMIIGLAIFAASAVFLTVVLILNLSSKPSSNSGIRNDSNDNPASSTETLQRNTSRERNVSLVVAAVTNYTMNNNSLPNNQTAYKDGQPDSSTQFGPYLNDLNANTKTVLVYRPASPIDNFSNSTSAPGLETITVLTGQECSGNTSTKASTSRHAAIVTKLESSDEQFYCQDVN